MFIHYKKFTICFGCLAACGGPCPAGRRPGPGMVSIKGEAEPCAAVFGRISFSQKTRKGQGAKNKRLPTGATPLSGQIHGTKRQGGLLSRQGFSPRRATRRAGIRAVQVPFPLPHNTNAPLPRRAAQKAQGSVSSQRVFSPHRERPGGPGSGAGCIPPAPPRQTACGPVLAVPRKKSRTACAVLLPVSFFAGFHAACFFRFFRRGWIASRSTRTSAVARLTRSAASHRLGSRKATRISPE